MIHSTGNVAYNKPTFQSGTYSEMVDGFDQSFFPDMAVDGTTDPELTHLHCAHPYTFDPDYSPQGGPAWWYVNLERTYLISTIYIYFRNIEAG